MFVLVFSRKIIRISFTHASVWKVLQPLFFVKKKKQKKAPPLEQAGSSQTTVCTAFPPSSNVLWSRVTTPHPVYLFNFFFFFKPVSNCHGLYLTNRFQPVTSGMSAVPFLNQLLSGSSLHHGEKAMLLARVLLNRAAS